MSRLIWQLLYIFVLSYISVEVLGVEPIALLYIVISTAAAIRLNQS